MLAVVVFKILGLVILGGLIGALVGLVITPFVLYLAYLVAYAIASTLVRSRQPTKPLNDIIHHSHPKEQTIKYAKHIPDFREYSNGIVDRNIVRHTPMPKKPSATPYGAPNQNIFDTVNQPAFKKASTIFHRIILFYRSYYGHSTKVEKNHGNLFKK